MRPLEPVMTTVFCSANARLLSADGGRAHRMPPRHRASRGSSRMKRPLRRSRSVCSISARVFITNGPWRAIGSPSGRAAARRNRPPPVRPRPRPRHRRRRRSGRARGRPSARARSAPRPGRGRRTPCGRAAPARGTSRPGGSVTSTNFGATARPSTGPDEPAPGRLAGDDPSRRAPSSSAVSARRSAARSRYFGRVIFSRAGRLSQSCSPPIPSGRTCGISSWRMPLPEVIHWMSPAPMAALVSQRIAVLHLSRPDDRDRLDAAMRMIGKARLVVGRVDRLEVVEQQERIEMVETAGSDAPAKVHPRPFDHRLRRHDLRDSARELIHAATSLDILLMRSAAPRLPPALPRVQLTWSPRHVEPSPSWMRARGRSAGRGAALHRTRPNASIRVAKASAEPAGMPPDARP